LASISLGEYSFMPVNLHQSDFMRSIKKPPTPSIFG
jgi:hypothetical protein